MRFNSSRMRFIAYNKANTKLLKVSFANQTFKGKFKNYIYTIHYQILAIASISPFGVRKSFARDSTINECEVA
jgi:hypothetical protein